MKEGEEEMEKNTPGNESMLSMPVFISLLPNVEWLGFAFSLDSLHTITIQSFDVIHRVFNDIHYTQHTHVYKDTCTHTHAHICKDTVNLLLKQINRPTLKPHLQKPVPFPADMLMPRRMSSAWGGQKALDTLS